MEHIKIPDEVQALRTEREDLEHRTFRLGAYLKSDEFKALEEIERDYLVQQHRYMEKYLNVLTLRLAHALFKV